MGCSVGNNESTVKTLSDWIHKAVLSNALSRAEHELKMKQQERRLRWELIKAKASEKVDGSKDVRWDEDVCEEITTSLDRFMSQMSFVQFSKA